MNAWASIFAASSDSDLMTGRSCRSW